MENVLEHQGFYGTVEYSSEDEVFHGRLIGINDLITFEGDAVTSLKNGFAEAVEDYIALCQEVGKPPLKSFKGSFNVRLTPELHRKAFVAAAINHVSLNAFVEAAISSKLKTFEHTEQETSASLAYFKSSADSLISDSSPS